MSSFDFRVKEKPHLLRNQKMWFIFFISELETTVQKASANRTAVTIDDA
jgi:hypothetical protein